MKKNFFRNSLVAVLGMVLLGSCSGAETAFFAPALVEETEAKVVEKVSVEDTLASSIVTIEETVSFFDGVAIDFHPTAELNCVLSKDTIYVDPDVEIGHSLRSTLPIKSNVSLGEGEFSTQYVFTDSQEATVNYGWTYELYQDDPTPHDEIQNVQYVQTESEELEAGVYKMTMVFTAEIVRVSADNSKTIPVELRPYYIKIVKSQPAVDVVTGVDYRFDESISEKGSLRISLMKITHHSLSEDTEEKIDVKTMSLFSGRPTDKVVNDVVNSDITMETSCELFQSQTLETGYWKVDRTEYANDFVRLINVTSGVRRISDNIVTAENVITYNNPELGLSKSFNIGVEIRIDEQKVEGDVHVLTLGYYVKGGTYHGQKVRTETSRTTLIFK